MLAAGYLSPLSSLPISSSSPISIPWEKQSPFSLHPKPVLSLVIQVCQSCPNNISTP